MRKVICTALFFIFFASLNAQDKTIRLIVREDDMAYTHSGNKALIKCYKEGIETFIEVIVASPWFPEAVKMFQQNPGVDVGIHLALTSEWDNIKWRPVSNCPSLKDSNGYFYPKVYPDKNYPGQSILENHFTTSDVEKEFRAQIEMALKKIPRISHVSSHMGCTDISDRVKALTKKLAKKYHIDIDLGDHQIIWKGYDGLSKSPAEKVKSFITMLIKLEPGKTYWFLDHPGMDDDELKADHHIGYEQVAADRQVVTDLFTSEKAKTFI